MRPNHFIANRIVYVLVMSVVVALGLSSRRYPDAWPQFWSTYAGDTLWALMVFLMLGFFFPALALWKRAAIALVFSILIEVSQLYQVPWIDAIRQTRLGALILGHGFLWSDLACYSIGVTAGWLVEGVIRRVTLRGTSTSEKPEHQITTGKEVPISNVQ